MKVQLEVAAPTDAERVAKAFGKKLNLDRPATPGEIEEDLAKYMQQTVQQQEQQSIFNAANTAAQKIPPVGVDTPDAPKGKE